MSEIYFDTGEQSIDDVIEYIKNGLNSEDSKLKNVCKLLFGKKEYNKKTNKYEFNINFWAENGYDIDFYAEAVLKNTIKKENDKILNTLKLNKDVPKEIKKINYRNVESNLFSRPEKNSNNYNEIKQYYLDSGFLFVFCKGNDNNNGLVVENGKYKLLNRKFK